MPKPVKQPPKTAPPPKPSPSPAQPFLAYGHAVALAKLAEAKGVHVHDVTPEAMQEIGLPAKLDRWVGQLAHDILRDKTDALLFRIRKTPMARTSLVTGTDGATMAEAREVEARSQEQERKQADRRDESRTEVLTKREQRVLVQKIKAAPPAPPSSGGFLMGRA